MLLEKTEGISAFIKKSDHILDRTRMSNYILFSADCRSSAQRALERASKLLKVLNENTHFSNYEKKLSDVGLNSGSADLSFKLRVFDKAARIFHIFGGIESLKDLLEIINTILGSLAEVFGILDKVTEIIELVRKLMDLSSREQAEEEMA